MMESESNLISETYGGETYQYYPMGEYIVRAPGICGGRPTFKYTRIEVTGTIERLAAGETMEELVVGYDGRVPKEAIAEALQLIAFHYIQNLPQLEPA